MFLAYDRTTTQDSWQLPLKIEQGLIVIFFARSEVSAIGYQIIH